MRELIKKLNFKIKTILCLDQCLRNSNNYVTACRFTTYSNSESYGQENLR